MAKPAAFFTLFFLVAALIACQDEKSVEYQRYYSLGKNLYGVHCQNCHGEKGEGLAGLYPPLSDTTFLRKNHDSLACWISKGLEKEIVINGKKYRAKMPADSDTSPIEIAQIVTYITNSFGNSQGFTDVDKVNVQLKNCR
ncbi:MAG: cytochrome c [Mucilaginibacter polytrichastri]|nr:cytochrome c [Mucilaginibacter polytrichastri]